MKKNINQHFIPQFYLRYFSENKNKKSISLWDIEKNLFIKCAGIKNQASSSYFYGKDSDLDKHLQIQETEIGKIFKILTEKNDLFKLKTKNHVNFTIFILTMLGRTEYSKDTANEVLNKFTKTILGVNKYTLIDKNAISNSVIRHSDSAYLISDLEFKMFYNKTNIPFILSDHPIVLHNQFMREKKIPTSHNGFCQTGLQILIPISPKHLIIFYDRKIYKIGKIKKERIIEISNQEDINSLNKLQFLNAYKTLFFNEKITNEYCDKISKQLKKLRNNEKVYMQELINTENPKNSLIVASKPKLNIDLKLSFAKIRKTAKINNDSSCNVRSKEMIEEYKKMLKEIYNFDIL